MGWKKFELKQLKFALFGLDKDDELLKLTCN